MEALIGITGKDYVIVAADASAARSIVVFKTDEDKILQLDSHKLLACSGPTGDRYQFCEFVQKNLHLHEMRTDVRMGTKAAAAWTRNELATALRKGPYQVNLLLAGYDKGSGPSLFFMDYMASMAEVPFGAHGYASNFVLSTMDRYWKKGMTLAEGKDVLKKCLHEIRTRFLVSLPAFSIKVITETGVEVITEDSL
mmetsp:Transcript_2331/g.3155  ORF Transcript_2331/g.3155 Transcript_2331/m.3155 type:complete len:196 (-) Transcript_2331:132-719(-)|eukprot:CAMPEP_0175104182 /NCGR_PEP_ID=MMETSP0086_2-20121207/9557_1 /TAXON_ID=136419 /ORGANISM="Unknown Unknown, Strain D1" /LENGTH=195 /DNA_ID=CAMNT_0016379489 /DNA_START=25 /DNA_END=612 /DNA_ORIENTATION=+